MVVYFKSCKFFIAVSKESVYPMDAMALSFFADDKNDDIKKQYCHSRQEDYNTA